MKITKVVFLLVFSINILSCVKGINVEHKVTYSNKGTKLEAEHGFLYINGQIVPDLFNLVVVNSISYKFYVRKNLWGRDGYFIISQKRKDIPPNLVYLKWNNNTKLIKHDEVFKFIRKQKIKRIDRTRFSSIFKRY